VFEDLESIKHEVDFAEKFAELKNYEFFSEFSTAEIWELLRAGEWRTYSSGETIIREGDRGNSVYIIVSGHATVSKDNQVLVDGAGPGECLGELAYLAEVERSATVTAKTDVAIMELNESALRTTEGTTQARFLNAFVKVLARRVVRMTDYIIDLKAVENPES
jgi:CRP-like cAMP-binding protein